VVALVAGDQNDGGFYQGQVSVLKDLSTTQGFDLVVIDKVGIGTSEEAFQNAVRQNPAIILSTGQELLDGFNAVCDDPANSSIFFMSQAAFPPQCSNAVHFTANDYQSHFMGGVAAALLLEQQGNPNGQIGVVAGPELSFVVADNKALEEGLKYRQPNASVDVTFTGDFENAALASEAAQAYISKGANMLYPYLGGALIAVVDAGNKANVPVLAVSIDGCAIPAGGPKFAGSVLFNPAAGFGPMFDQYVSGELKPGDFKVFGVDTPGVGANICGATAQQTQVLEDVRQKLLGGDITVQAGSYQQ
jgi:basic membrane protein A